MNSSMKYFKQVNVLYSISLIMIYSQIINCQNIIYVKNLPSGKQDGSSWENATANLQEAINNSKENDEIWVAAGVYKPTSDFYGNTNPANIRDRSFLIRRQIKLVGGFNGTESSSLIRNIEENKTILSGDFEDNDSLNYYTEDNAFHVISALGYERFNLLIDGFYITGGNSNNYKTTTINNFELPGLEGSGFVSVNNDCTINNCRIYSNAFGGIFLSNSTSKISNCIISDNLGSGIKSLNSINVICNNIIKNNKALGSGDMGSGIFIDRGKDSIYNNFIHGNQSYGQGSGLYLKEADIIINDNYIYNNSNDYGSGGGISSFKCNLSLNNNKIFNNISISYGGISAYQGQNSYIGNYIYNNIALSGPGGGMGINKGNNTLINNVIYGNSSTNNGGGILIDGGANYLINNTIVSNSSGKDGGGLAIYKGDYILKNNIIWKNIANSSGSSMYYVPNESILSISNSIFEFGYVDCKNCPNGNGDINPQFLNLLNILGNDGILGSTDDGLTLSANSIAINNGSSVGAPNYDITNNIRQGLPDIGAYEFNIQTSTQSLENTNYIVYPNPTNNFVNIDFNTSKSNDFSIKIFDFWGKEIFKVFCNSHEFLKYKRIDLSDLPPGIYFLNVDDRRITKIIKL